ncbi:MAG: hypothetical protein KDB88_03365 [Flavobacteriales bacterium]|nr:hypothetical protein [Flavobacteriales bacterium]
MSRTVLLLTFLLPALSYGQKEVRITGPEQIRTEKEPLRNKAALAGLQASGLPEEQATLVRSNSVMDLWPVGLKNDSARAVNLPYIKNYVAFKLFGFVDDTSAMQVVMVPAKENIHMPEDLRPTADLFLVVPEGALRIVTPAKTRPEISRGPKWKDRGKAKILLPDDLYATYDLGNDSSGMEALRRAGMSQAEMNAVVFRSHERNWPEGIDSFDERYPRLEQFKKYKAYLGAKWDDKVLLIIPSEKNRKMPTLMRPFVDIYFVYRSTAVNVKTKR